MDAQRRVFAEQGHRALDSQPDYLKGELRNGLVFQHSSGLELGDSCYTS